MQLTVDVKDQNRQRYAVVFLKLDPSKDFMDLMAATAGGPSAWSEAFPYREGGPGAARIYEISGSTDPLYSICFAKPPDHAIGNLGSFDVIH